MTPSRSIRLVAALVLGAAAAVAAWLAAAPIEPHLDIQVRRENKTRNYELWGIGVTVRGGEPVDEVRIERVSGPLTFVTQPSIQRMKAGWSAAFRMQLDGEAPGVADVRVVQTGRVPRTYDVKVGRAP